MDLIEIGIEKMLRDPRGVYRWDDVLYLTEGVIRCRPSFILPNGRRDIRRWI
jgi:hypothetical protein